MATLIPLPPKKKSRTWKNQHQQAQQPHPHLRTQLKDDRTGWLILPSLSLPTQTKEADLELIVNKLGQDTWEETQSKQ